MAITKRHIAEAVRIARDYGATRVVVFGSALDSPDAARDLDVAVEGVEGWGLYRLSARLDRALGVPVDVLALDPPTPFTRRVERWGREVYPAASE